MPKFYFPRFLEKPPHLWEMLFGNSVPSYIEVARLVSRQKSGELSVSRRKKKQGVFNPIRLKFKVSQNFGAFRISTNSKRQSIRYPLLCIETQFDEADMNDFENCGITALPAGACIVQLRWRSFICSGQRPLSRAQDICFRTIS